MIVTKQIEWDMGHRVLNHHSKCKNLHGHRYKLEISLEGDLVNKEGSSDEGMVIDFGDIKTIAMKYIHDELDHAFMVWDKDQVMMQFFLENKELKYNIVEFTPTAENIAYWIFNTLKDKYADKYSTGLKLKEVKLWETPKSFVIYTEN